MLSAGLRGRNGRRLAPLSPRWQRIVVALPLATGAALAVYLVAGISLGLALFATIGVAAITVMTAWRHTPRDDRAALAHRARTGLVIGMVATAAYDLTRFAGAELGGTSIQPFDIWHLFGQTLVGTHASSAYQWIAGTAFHYANGLGFAVAYVVLVRRPQVWTALLWAAVLNGVMLAMYPPWLGLSPVATEELAFVSILGHTAYGLVLGSASKAVMHRHLAREEIDQWAA